MQFNGIQLRHEKKYFISQNTMMNLRMRLEHAIEIDINADDENTYTVTSLYFDDMFNSAYFTKHSGIHDRSKYRIRIYKRDLSRLVLEKKIKRGEYIGKVSCELNIEEYQAIYTGRHAEILLQSKHKLLHEVYSKIRVARLSPRVIVEYNREAYVLRHGNVRITFDKDLRAGIHNLDLRKQPYDVVRAIHEQKVIMEVKFDHYMPSVVRNLLSETGREYMSISKYVLCSDIDYLYGGKLNNAKHTNISRHF